LDWGIVARDTATVLIEYVKVLAWPAVVLIAFKVFGETIKETIGRIEELAASGVTAKLGVRSSQLKDKAQHLPTSLKVKRGTKAGEGSSEPAPAPSEVPEPAGPGDSAEKPILAPPAGEVAESVTEEVENAAIGQVVRSWTELEKLTLDLHQRLFSGAGGSQSPYRRPSSVIAAVADLQRNNMVDSSTAATFRRAQEFRNVVMHDGDVVTFATYAEFLETLEALKDTVRLWQAGML
jgi:hypothetical protein